MKEVLWLLIAILVTFSVTASEIDDFISSIKDNPDDFAVVISPLLSQAESNVAYEFADTAGITLLLDVEVSSNTNLVVVGSSDKNQKTAEICLQTIELFER